MDRYKFKSEEEFRSFQIEMMIRTEAKIAGVVDLIAALAAKLDPDVNKEEFGLNKFITDSFKDRYEWLRNKYLEDAKNLNEVNK